MARSLEESWGQLVRLALPFAPAALQSGPACFALAVAAAAVQLAAMAPGDELAPFDEPAAVREPVVAAAAALLAQAPPPAAVLVRVAGASREKVAAAVRRALASVRAVVALAVVALLGE